MRQMSSRAAFRLGQDPTGFYPELQISEMKRIKRIKIKKKKKFESVH